MSYIITVNPDGSVTLPQAIIDAFPDAEATIEDKKLILENICRYFFVDLDFVEGVEPLTGEVFYKDEIGFSSTDLAVKHADVIDKCDVFGAGRMEGDATIGPLPVATVLFRPLLKSLQSYYLSQQGTTIFDYWYPRPWVSLTLNFSPLYQRYVDAKISLEEMVGEMFDLYIKFGGEIPVRRDSYVQETIDQLSEIPMDEYRHFLDLNLETLSAQEVADALKELEDGNLYGPGIKTIIQRRDGGFYKIEKSGASIVHLMSKERLDEETRKEIFENATSIHFDTLIANFGEGGLSGSKIRYVETDWGGVINIHDGGEKVDLYFTSMARSERLLGMALSEVMCRFGSHQFRVFAKDKILLEYIDGVVYGENRLERDVSPDKFSNYDIAERKVNDSGCIVLNGMASAEKIRAQLSDDEQVGCGSLLNKITLYFYRSGADEASRDLIEKCRTIKSEKVSCSFLVNLDIFPCPLYSENGELMLSKSFLDYRKTFGCVTYELLLPSTRSLTTVKFRNGDVEYLPKIFDEMIFVGNDGETVVTGDYASEDLGDVGTRRLYDIGVRNFYKPVSCDDVLLPGTIFRSHGCLHTAGELILAGNVLGYDDGVLRVFKNDEAWCHVVFVNGVDRWGRDLAEALLINEDVHISAEAGVRSADIQILQDYFEKIQYAIKNYMFPLDRMNDLYKTDPLAYERHLANAQVFFANLIDQRSIYKFANGEEIVYTCDIRRFNHYGSGRKITISGDSVDATDLDFAVFSLARDGSSYGERENIISVEVDGNYILRCSWCIGDKEKGTDRTCTRVYDLRTFDSEYACHEGCPGSTDCPAPNPEVPEKDGMTVTYRFNVEDDGSVAITYVARDAKGNDITSLFNTFTVGDRFMHKEME